MSTCFSQLFAVTETNGLWSLPAVIDATLNVGSMAQVITSACDPNGYCYLLADVSDTRGSQNTDLPFVQSELDGTWQSPSVYPNVSLSGITCLSDGSCIIFGSATSNSGAAVAMTMTGSGSSWGSPLLMPSLPGTFNSLQCWTATDCAAVGSDYTPDGLFSNHYLATESQGTWSAPVYPGLDLGASSITVYLSLSCGTAGHCVAAGLSTTECKSAATIGMCDEKYFGVVAGGPNGWLPPKTLFTVPGGPLIDGSVQLVCTDSDYLNCVASGFLHTGYKRTKWPPQFLVTYGNGRWSTIQLESQGLSRYSQQVLCGQSTSCSLFATEGPSIGQRLFKFQISRGRVSHGVPVKLGLSPSLTRRVTWLRVYPTLSGSYAVAGRLSGLRCFINTSH